MIANFFIKIMKVVYKKLILFKAYCQRKIKWAPKLGYLFLLIIVGLIIVGQSFTFSQATKLNQVSSDPQFAQVVNDLKQPLKIATRSNPVDNLHITNSFSADNLIKVQNTIVQNGDFRLTGDFNANNHLPYISLNWDSVPKAQDGYHVQRTTNPSLPSTDVGWTAPPTNYDKKVKILNVYPQNGNYLKKWMDQTDPQTGNPVSMGLIDVTPVSLREYKLDPDKYLKDSKTGEYQYDGIYFGSSDMNYKEDLNNPAIKATFAFGATGRTVIFGHDTVDIDNPNFSFFASFLGIQIAPYDEDKNPNNDLRLGSSTVKFSPGMQKGFLAKYPWNLTDATFPISPTHNGAQFQLYGKSKKWMEFVPPFKRIGRPSSNNVQTHYLDDKGKNVATDNGQRIGDNNWYLVTNDNYAMIQTGHTLGRCTPEEAKLIANMIYYTSTLNTSTTGEDRNVSDETKPATPQVKFSQYNDASGDKGDFRIISQDSGTDYYYRVKTKAQNQDVYSDTIKVTVPSSGMKGYIYQIDDNANTPVKVDKDVQTGEVTNINLAPNSSQDSNAMLKDISRVGNTNKYLHIVAVDNNNNISDTTTIDFNKAFSWWAYQDQNKTLTIYPHELNYDKDKVLSNNDSANPQYDWPWFANKTDIQTVEIKAGVSAAASLENLFADCSQLRNITGLTNIDTSQVTSMAQMFKNCTSLTELDFSNFDTNKVTNFADMLSNTPALWKLTLGPQTRLSYNNVSAGLVNPVNKTKINDLNDDGSHGDYYATDSYWQKVDSNQKGNAHNPLGELVTADQIILNSGHVHNSIDTYVWAQTGKLDIQIQPTSVDFQKQIIPWQLTKYQISIQDLKVIDSRQGRKNKSWKLTINAQDLTNVNDSTKVISGTPLSYQDSSNNLPLTNTPQLLYREVGSGQGYQDVWDYPWYLNLQVQRGDIPVAGKYKSQIIYTVIDSI